MLKRSCTEFRRVLQVPHVVARSEKKSGTNSRRSSRNNETYFFRERAQLDVLLSDVVDESLRAGGRLRIWSSACSTGEEPYTIAMMLLEGRRIAPSNMILRASDLSPRALDKARTGFYRELSFRATPPEMVQRYFRPFEQGFFVNDEVKRMVDFFRINLLDAPAVAATGTFDAIFCRNVLIYFDKPTQKRVVEAFARRCGRAASCSWVMRNRSCA